MDVTAKYELIGLMAYPIRHSLSPEMQNKALEKRDYLLPTWHLKSITQRLPMPLPD